MLYMLIERYSSGPRPVYERAAARGRMLPDGLRYVDSWVVDDGNLDRCFQLMETDDPALFDVWRERWADLGDFEVHPVITSAEAAARVDVAWPSADPADPADAAGVPMMPAIDPIDPADLPESSVAYTHGTVVSGAQRLVFVSGQPPWAADGPVPDGFDDQCRLAWRNVERVLTEAGLTLRDLAKVTVYLSDRRHRDANSRIRAEVLGDHRPAVTVIITDIYSEEWLLEIEAIAAAHWP